MDAIFQEKKKGSLDLGVEEVKRTATIDDIRNELNKGAHPIVLISTRMMWEIRPIPHWIVVIDVDGKHVTIQNPETARVERYRIKRFERYMGFDGQMRMVCIYPQ
jgi:predicted double-glycine peptidase